MSENTKAVIIDNNFLYILQTKIQEVVEQELRFIIKFKQFDRGNKGNLWLWKEKMNENEIKIFREWCVINDLLIKDDNQ